MIARPSRVPARPADFNTPEAEDWFGQLMHQIKTDQLQLQTGSADVHKAEFYHNAISGNVDGVLKNLRSQSTQYFVSQIIRTFVNELSEKKALPKKLAFALTPSTILAWVEITENDEATEDGIILAESVANCYAKEFEFCVDTMIVEDSDSIPVPAHYVSVIS